MSVLEIARKPSTSQYVKFTGEWRRVEFDTIPEAIAYYKKIRGIGHKIKLDFGAVRYTEQDSPILYNICPDCAEEGIGAGFCINCGGLP